MKLISLLLKIDMTQKNKNPFNSEPLSTKDKLHLRHRIFSSIYHYKRKKRVFRFGVGASVAVVLLLVTFSVLRGSGANASGIEHFVASQKDIPAGQEIQLILNDQHKVNVSEDNAKISYSATGKEVRIGDSKALNQNANPSEAIVYNTLLVPYGKRSEITLSDGSKVWLNSGSKLVFPAKFAAEKREVYLEGEAIFEVSHNENKPFHVQSKNHDLQVLGTVFNLSNYKDDAAIYTVLKSGSVQINYKTNALFNTQKSVKIKPGMLSAFNKNDREVQKSQVDVERYFSWRDGVFIFKNDALKSIMKKLSRYYNVEISIADDALANETFSGYLDVKDNIESVMETIKAAETPGFTYERTAEHKLIISLKQNL
jgi:hypothetical protein